MQITRTEKRLCRMWTATDFGGDWFELNKTLWEISQTLRASADDIDLVDHSNKLIAIADDFAFCASIALQRAVDETQARKMNAFGSALNDAVARGETFTSMVTNLIGDANYLERELIKRKSA